MNTSVTMTPTRTAPGTLDSALIQQDAQALFTVFQHNKNSTLDHGYLRGTLVREYSAQLTHERQNAALELLVKQRCITQVAYGRWRFQRPERVSRTVLRSAPITAHEKHEYVTAVRDLPAPPSKEPVPLSRRFRSERAELAYEFIVENPGCTLKDLAAFLDCSQAQHTVSALLTGFTKKHFVAREKINNRFCYYVPPAALPKVAAPPSAAPSVVPGSATVPATVAWNDTGIRLTFVGKTYQRSWDEFVTFMERRH